MRMKKVLLQLGFCLLITLGYSQCDISCGECTGTSSSECTSCKNAQRFLVIDTIDSLVGTCSDDCTTKMYWTDEEILYCAKTYSVGCPTHKAYWKQFKPRFDSNEALAHGCTTCDSDMEEGDFVKCTPTYSGKKGPQLCINWKCDLATMTQVSFFIVFLSMLVIIF